MFLLATDKRNELQERLEILRRAAERGRLEAWDLSSNGDRKAFLDHFQHILNEIALAKKCLP